MSIRRDNLTSELGRPTWGASENPVVSSPLKQISLIRDRNDAVVGVEIHYAEQQPDRGPSSLLFLNAGLLAEHIEGIRLAGEDVSGEMQALHLILASHRSPRSAWE